jgi:heavy metal sensor kinase
LIAGQSISLRLTIWYSAVFFAGLILFGAAMWLELEHSLSAERVRTAAHRADRLSELLRDSRGDPAEERARKFRAFANATGGGLVQVVNPKGIPVFPLTSAAMAFPWPATEAATAREQLREVSFSGEPYLVLMRPLIGESEPLYVHVATPLSGNRQLLERFTLGLLATIPVLLLVSALGGYFLSRRALRPVDRITASARSISISNLSGRVPVPNSGDELQRLAETCNAMLMRLESAVIHIRQFTADASHELRTPLSFMRTIAELALRNPRIDLESTNAFREIVEECGKSARLLEDMLTLARGDAGDARIVFEPVDLSAVVREACEKARPIAESQQHTLSVSNVAQGSIEILGDYSSLRRLVWIILDNAIKYTPASGHIEVAVGAVDGHAKVTIKDNGIGIPSADLPHVFERFYRADPSRSKADGAGLGLAIAKWIVDTHHGDLSISSRENIGTELQVVFPLWARRPASAASGSTTTGVTGFRGTWQTPNNVA